MHFTPTSASWLNQVERWFAMLTERQIRRGTHRSTVKLENAIRSDLALNNRDPKPFVWKQLTTSSKASSDFVCELLHTLAIYQHIPNSQLAIFPNATHMIPFDDPASFNATVDRFLRAKFVKKDRVNDTMKSLEKLRAAAR